MISLSVFRSFDKAFKTNSGSSKQQQLDINRNKTVMYKYKARITATCMEKSHTGTALYKLYYQSLKLDCNYSLINLENQFPKPSENRRKLALAVWYFAFDIHKLYMWTKNARHFRKAISFYFSNYQTWRLSTYPNYLSF